MNKLIIIGGPTGVGKSELAIKLAKQLNGEIISADSMQVYRGLDIGSAKVTQNEMDGVVHHMIDILDPSEEFGVSIFVDKASDLIKAINEKGNVPIVVGGTSFYIQALLKGVDFKEEPEEKEYRKQLDTLSESVLYDKLLEIDPDYAKTTHMNNKKRVIRALEYNYHTGKLFSEYNDIQSKRPYLYDFLYFVINDDRNILYSRCDMRVNKMLKSGLLEEAQKLYDLKLDRNATSMQGIGYRELFDYFDGNLSLDDAIDSIKLNTRHYVKRQITWLKREKDTIWFNRQELTDDEIILSMLKYWREI